MKIIKKILLILILFFLSTLTIYAENISIETITLDSKSPKTEILDEPTYEGLSIKFNLKFVEVGDFAKYKIVINNEDNEDYEIDINQNDVSNYIKYDYIFPNEDNIIPKNSKSTIYVTINYFNELEDYITYETGNNYIENSNLVINLGNDIITNPVVKTIEDIVKNPNTGDKMVLIIITLLIVISLLLVIKKYNKQNYISILILLLIPVTIYAINKIKISVDSKILIEKKINMIESRYNNGNTYDERDYWEYQDYIENITFNNRIIEPDDYEEAYDISENKDESVIAYLAENENDLYDLYIMAEGNIYANPDSSSLFYGFGELENINNLEYFRTIYAEDMSSMFGNIYNMEELDLSTFDTRNVVNMNNIFSQNQFKEIDLSNLNTKNVRDMSYMFYMTSRVKKLDLSSFDTSNVTDMSWMFYNCGFLEELNLGNNFNTMNVTNMEKMFTNTGVTENFKGFNLEDKFDTRNVTNMDGMFGTTDDISRNITELDLGYRFDTSKVINMFGMFSGNHYLKSLDLSGFDTRKVENMSYMFNTCFDLENIYISDKWDTSNVSNSYNMFKSTGLLPNHNENIIDKTKAYAGDGGYLTFKE